MEMRRVSLALAQHSTTHLPDRHGRSAPRAGPLSLFMVPPLLFFRPKALAARVLSILAARAGKTAAFWALLRRSRKEPVIYRNHAAQDKKGVVFVKMVQNKRGRRRVQGGRRHDGREGEQWIIQIVKKQQTNASVIGPWMRGFLHP